MKRIVVISLTMVSFTALAQTPQSPPQANATAPAQNNSAQTDNTPSAADLLRTNGGSLLRAGLATGEQPGPGKGLQVSFFDVPAPEPRVMKKHDLVTIIVREASEFTSEGNTDLKRQADIDAKIEQFIKLALDEGGIGAAVGETTPEIKLSAERNFKGEATVDRTDTFITRITAEVVDVKPNGTLVLQARSRIKTDEEEQLLVLAGTCRAEDVTADNSILSTQLFDKELTKTNKGAVRDTTKRGLLQRLLDAVNPF